MSGIPAFEKFDYRLRPAKNVERKMICEALGRLTGAGKLSGYQYVGFGAVGFNCFSLFHQRLGISDMVSIERHLDSEERFARNKPYSCIKIHFGKSDEILPKLEWKKKRSVVWLDYEDHINERALSDTALMAGKVRSGSVLLVTLNADTKNDVGAPKECLDRLKSFVDPVLIRPGIEPVHMAGWGYAKVCANILLDLVQNTLNDRNAALQPNEKLKFSQLFNFTYRDGSQMMTFGGIFFNPGDQFVFNPAHFEDLPFVRTGDQQFEIKIPVLTLREIKYLDSLLPRRALAGKNPFWIPIEQRKRYREIYRYFPYFHELEAT